MPRFKLPPGPDSGLFGARHLKANRIDPVGFMTDLAARYGDIVHFRAGLQRVYFLNNPEFVSDVLATHATNFVKGRGIKRNRRLLGNGLITSEGEVHRRMRQRTAPAFHRKRLDEYSNVMVESTVAHANHWQEGDFIDILQEMRALMMAIVGRTMFSFDAVDEIAELSRALETAMFQFKAFKVGVPEWVANVLSPAARRANQADEYLEREMCRLIAERRRTGHDNGDLLTMLLMEHDAQGEGEALSNKQVRDEALTIFLAAYETNATALMWTWYLLAQHPDVEAKLHAELDEVLGSRAPTLADVPNLVYTEKVFNESLRLYPPAWRLVRYAIGDYEVGGYTVPAGALVVISQFVMQRDARYFPDPLRFDPERWTVEAKASRLPGTFFPFGGGVRRCVGESFAILEAVLVIATLAREWRFRRADDASVELASVQLLRPRQRLRMVLDRRRREATNTPSSYSASASSAAR
jgi:cytochrome P450